jgi:hypothetical protein
MPDISDIIVKSADITESFCTGVSTSLESAFRFPMAVIYPSSWDPIKEDILLSDIGYSSSVPYLLGRYSGYVVDLFLVASAAGLASKLLG